MDFVANVMDELREGQSARTWANLWGRTIGALIGAWYLSGASDSYLPGLYDAALLGTRAAFGLFATVLAIEILKWVLARIDAKRRAAAGKNLLDVTLSGRGQEPDIIVGWLRQGPIIKVPTEAGAHNTAAKKAEMRGGLEFVRETGTTLYYKVHPDLLFYLKRTKRIE